MSRQSVAQRPHHEMVQKSHFRDTFFSVKSVTQQRPDSVHTEFMETDWEEDDILSELEDDDDASPRPSLDSVSYHPRCQCINRPANSFGAVRVHAVANVLTCYCLVWPAKYDHTVNL